MYLNIVELVESIVDSWSHFLLELVEASTLGYSWATGFCVHMHQWISGNTSTDSRLISKRVVIFISRSWFVEVTLRYFDIMEIFKVLVSTCTVTVPKHAHHFLYLWDFHVVFHFKFFKVHIFLFLSFLLLFLEGNHSLKWSKLSLNFIIVVEKFAQEIKETANEWNEE